MLRRMGRKSEWGEPKAKAGHPWVPRTKSILLVQLAKYSCRTSGRWCRLRNAFLLYFLHLVDQIVGLLLQSRALVGSGNGIRFAAIEQVEIGHGVIIVRADRNGLLKSADAFVDDRAILGQILTADCGRQRIGFLYLFADILFVVFLTHFTVGAEGEGPINDADPVIRFGVLRLQLDMFLMVAFGFLKKFWVVGGSCHLEKNGTNTVNGAEIIRVRRENLFKLLDGLLTYVFILL